jgi:hypothetical protein
MQTQNQSQTQAPVRIQKLISFPPELYDFAKTKANKFGFTFSEYIKHLIANDVKFQVEQMEMVDTETEASIARSVEDFKKGRYTVLKTEEDIDKHFGGL